MFHYVTNFIFLSFLIRRKVSEKLLLEGKVKILTLRLTDPLWESLK